jgi:hypothetical protein
MRKVGEEIKLWREGRSSEDVALRRIKAAFAVVRASAEFPLFAGGSSKKRKSLAEIIDRAGRSRKFALHAFAFIFVQSQAGGAAGLVLSPWWMG